MVDRSSLTHTSTNQPTNTQVPRAIRMQRVQEMEAMLGLEDAREVLVGGDAFHQVDVHTCIYVYIYVPVSSAL